MSTAFYSLSISLFDSLSTTQQIIVFVLLLTTEKPLRNALSYLAGLSGAYCACGICGYLALDQVRALLSKFIPSISGVSNPAYYQSEFLTGVIMTGLGVWYFRKKKQDRPGRAQNMILAKLKSMNGYFAFGIGVFISITSFPVSIPYLIALGKYTTMHLGLFAAFGYIALYNFGYALPMVLALVVYLIMRAGANDFHDTLHAKADALNRHLTTWTLAGFGIFSIVDSGCYFALGRALVKGRYF
jgi:cytochrome c biogenesis protein CcdA